MTNTGTTASNSGLLSKAVPISVLVAVAAMFVLAANLGTNTAGSKATAGMATAPGMAGLSAAKPAAPAVNAAATGSPNQAQIEQIVRNYLLTNPEIMLEVQAAYETKMEGMREEMMKAALTDSADDIFRSPGAPTTGNTNGDVTVVEFLDYNCGFCRKALDGMIKVIDSDAKVKFVLKELPIFGQESEDAAKVALAAKNQGKYWEVHTALLTQPGRANKDKGLKIARELGLDMSQLETDMESSSVNGEIKRVADLAQKLGIQGTPHFLIDNKVIPGAPADLFEQISSTIAQVRKSGCQYC